MKFLIEVVENGYILVMAIPSKNPETRYVFKDLEQLFSAVREAIACSDAFKKEMPTDEIEF